MLVLTGHQFIFSSPKKEIFVLHKLVDLVEKESEKGRIQIQIRLKTGQLIRFGLNSQVEADNVSESIQLCGMVKFRDAFPFYFNPTKSYEQMEEFAVPTTQVWFKSLRNKVNRKIIYTTRSLFIMTKFFRICVLLGRL